MALLKLRAYIPPMCRNFSKAQQDIDACNSTRRSCQCLIGYSNLAQNIQIDAPLQLLDMLNGGQDTRLVLLKFRSNKTFGIDQRLLAHIIIGGQFQIGVADLDIVAKDLVKTDFETLDARAL